MQFESKIKRQYWINSILGLIPDLVIAGVITSVIGGAIGTFVLALVALQVVYFLVWLRKTIWAWIVFGVYGRKHIAGYLTDYLVENDFPEPGIYEGSAEELPHCGAAFTPRLISLTSIGRKRIGNAIFGQLWWRILPRSTAPKMP
jgi:hypothetical protein